VTSKRPPRTRTLPTAAGRHRSCRPQVAPSDRTGHRLELLVRAGSQAAGADGRGPLRLRPRRGVSRPPARGVGRVAGRITEVTVPPRSGVTRPSCRSRPREGGGRRRAQRCKCASRPPPARARCAATCAASTAMGGAGPQIAGELGRPRCGPCDRRARFSRLPRDRGRGGAPMRGVHECHSPRRAGVDLEQLRPSRKNGASPKELLVGGELSTAGLPPPVRVGLTVRSRVACRQAVLDVDAGVEGQGLPGRQAVRGERGRAMVATNGTSCATACSTSWRPTSSGNCDDRVVVCARFQSRSPFAASVRRRKIPSAARESAEADRGKRDLHSPRPALLVDGGATLPDPPVNRTSPPPRS